MPLSTYQQSVGNTSTSFPSFNTSGPNLDNQVETESQFTPNTAVRIIKCTTNLGSNTASAVTARVMGWDQSGNIIFEGPQFSSVGNPGAGAYTALAGGNVIGSQINVAVGFWYSSAGSAKGIWQVHSTGTFDVKTNLGADVTNMSGDSACGAPFTCGSLLGYADLAGGDMKTLERGMVARVAKRYRVN